jgi:hypothetical protein
MICVRIKIILLHKTLSNVKEASYPFRGIQLKVVEKIIENTANEKNSRLLVYQGT